MEVFQLQEEVEETSDQDRLRDLLRQVRETFHDIQREFAEQIEAGDEAAVATVIKLRYFYKVI